MWCYCGCGCCCVCWPTPAEQLIKLFSLIAVTGPIGTPTTLAALPLALQYNVPIIGAVTGSMSLRVPYDPLLVNIRSVQVLVDWHKALTWSSGKVTALLSACGDL